MSETPASVQTPDPPEVRGGPPRPGPLDWARILLLTVLWGSAFATIEVALESLSPGVIVMLRMWIAALILLAVAVIVRSPLPRLFPRPDPAWGWLAGIGLIGNAIPFFLTPWAQQTTTSGMTGIIVATAPLFVALMAHFVVPGERLTARRTLGLLVAFAGVGVLFWPSIVSGARNAHALAMGAVLLAAFFYALTAILARFNTHRAMIGGAAAVCLVAALATTPLGLWDVAAHGVTFTPRSAAAVIALGIAPTALATIVYMYVARTAGPSFLSLTNYIVPLFTVAVGAALLRERLEASAFAALALILLGLFLANRRRRV